MQYFEKKPALQGYDTFIIVNIILLPPGKMFFHTIGGQQTGLGYLKKQT